MRLGWKYGKQRSGPQPGRGHDDESTPAEEVVVARLERTDLLCESPPTSVELRLRTYLISIALCTAYGIPRHAVATLRPPEPHSRLIFHCRSQASPPKLPYQDASSPRAELGGLPRFPVLSSLTSISE